MRNTGAKPILSPNCMIPKIKKGVNSDLDKQLKIKHLPVQVTWWFLVYDSCEISACVEDYSPTHKIFTSIITYLHRPCPYFMSPLIVLSGLTSVDSG